VLDSRKRGAYKRKNDLNLICCLIIDVDSVLGL
jgi:hypothetical protein